ncbi:ATP-dependent DNA ligase [Isoptericola sp. NPDC055881]
MSLPPGLRLPVDVALARAVEQIPAPTALPGGCLYEPKWDGFRCVIARDGARVSLWSGRGTDLTATFPEVGAAAGEQFASGTVLDAELVVWTSGRLDFGALQERMGRGSRAAAQHARSHPASAAVFDVLATGGDDVRSMPLSLRRALLEDLAALWRPPLNLPPITSDVDRRASGSRPTSRPAWRAWSSRVPGRPTGAGNATGSRSSTARPWTSSAVR